MVAYTRNPSTHVEAGGLEGKGIFGYRRPEGICHLLKVPHFILSKAYYTMLCPRIILT